MGGGFFGRSFSGPYYNGSPRDKAKGWLQAIDVGAGKVRWRKQWPTPLVAGVTVTSGNVLFTGHLGVKRTWLSKCPLMTQSGRRQAVIVAAKLDENHAQNLVPRNRCERRVVPKATTRVLM
jgi:hypothetical protein